MLAMHRIDRGLGGMRIWFLLALGSVTAVACQAGDTSHGTTTGAGSSSGGGDSGVTQPVVTTLSGRSRFGLAFGGVSGNLYVTDFEGNQIDEIALDGQKTILAGNGIAGYLDGPANSAEFGELVGVVLDGEGNVYVSDDESNTIRKLDIAGNVTTVAGDGHAGDLDGMGTSAEFNAPWGIALDGSGNIFVADSRNNRIRKIDATGLVTTVAGNGSPGFRDGSVGRTGSAEFREPLGVAVDANGNLYVADTGNQRIRQISAAAVSTLAGNGVDGGFLDGQASKAEFNGPFGLAVDSVGNVFVADAYNNRVRSLSAQGVVNTLAGNGQEGKVDGTGGADGNAELTLPLGVALGVGAVLYVSGNDQIRKISW